MRVEVAEELPVFPLVMAHFVFVLSLQVLDLVRS